MKNTSKQIKLNVNNNTVAMTSVQEQTVEVLYQKMGNRWFAFSVRGDDVFVGSISQEVIDQLNAAPSVAGSAHSIVGNS